MTDTRVLLIRLTPPGRSAVAGLALVGDGAAELAGRFFRGQPLREDGSVRVGVFARGTEPVDQVVAVRRSASHVEIFCHGGAVSVARLTTLFRDAGAVEEQAPLVLSLSKDEPAADVIRREVLTLLPGVLTERAARMLLAQEEGVLASWARGVAARLDAGEAIAVAELSRMLGTFRAGRSLVEPARLAIAGPPNAGKSTLLNRLYGEPRAVVSAEAGTTRDPVETLIGIDGVPFRLVDTAGLGTPRDALDAQGQEHARKRIAGADLVLAVFDGADPDFSPSRAREEWFWLDPGKTLWIGNKSDVAPRVAAPGWLSASALTGDGIDALGRAIVGEVAGAIPVPGEPCLFTERQEAIVRRALESSGSGAFPDAARILGGLD